MKRSIRGICTTRPGPGSGLRRWGMAASAFFLIKGLAWLLGSYWLASQAFE